MRHSTVFWSALATLVVASGSGALSACGGSGPSLPGRVGSSAAAPAVSASAGSPAALGQRQPRSDPAGGAPSNAADGASAATAAPSAALHATADASATTRPFRLLWAKPGVAWTKAVVIAPWGDVVSFGSRKLNLHAGDTGDLLAQKAICYTFADAFGFVDHRTGVLVCEDSIKVYVFPGLTYRGVRSLPGKARTASFGHKFVAVGFAEGPVRVYDTRDWSQFAHFALGGRASVLAMAPEERVLAVGLRDGRLVLCDLESKQQRSLRPKLGHPVAALAFSADGARLFASAGPVAAVWRVADGSRERVLSAARGANAASWTSSNEIATTSAAGLLLVSLDDDVARGIDGRRGKAERPPVDVAVSGDARLLCTGEAQGTVRCFSKGRIARRPAEPGGSAEGEPAMAVTPGRIIGHTGKRLTMQAHPRTRLPAAGLQALLLRHVLFVRGELTTHGWPEIAEVSIDEVRKGRLHLTILEDKSSGVLGESKQDPFGYDTQVRLVWRPR